MDYLDKIEKENLRLVKEGSCKCNYCLSFLKGTYQLKKDKTIIGEFYFSSIDPSCCFKRRRHVHISSFSIKAKHRNKEYGKAMMHLAIKLAKENKYKFIKLNVDKDNVPAKKVYETLGFKFNKSNDCYYTNHRSMKRKL